MVKLTLLISKEAGGDCLPTVSSLWGLLMKHLSWAFIRQGHGLSDLGMRKTTSKMTLEVPQKVYRRQSQGMSSSSMEIRKVLIVLLSYVNKWIYVQTVFMFLLPLHVCKSDNT